MVLVQRTIERLIAFVISYTLSQRARKQEAEHV
jgi:hypothetical protein